MIGTTPQISNYTSLVFYHLNWKLKNKRNVELCGFKCYTYCTQ